MSYVKSVDERPKGVRGWGQTGIKKKKKKEAGNAANTKYNKF